ncbi:MAG: hypothetical protein RJA10_3069 [Pseudomonadota bacterium]
MNQLRRTVTALAAATLAFNAWALGDKPLKLIVPAPPGGTMDIVARLLGQQLQADIGQPVVIENKPGAGGGIGIQALLQAPADGNTLLVGASNLLAEIQHDARARDFKALVGHLERNKGKASYATYSAGTVSHYAGAIMSDQLGLDLQHIPFAGSPPALQNLLGGQVDIMFDGMLTSVPMIRGGKLRAYAYTGSTRSRHLPDVPTMAELGFPQLQFVGWVGVIASSKLPPAELAKVQAALKKAASAPAVQQKLFETGLDPEVNVDTPSLVRETNEISERNGAIVRKFGIKL